ncbi:MAG: hypothetical protein EWV41_14830 [Microcystis wesenbergii Mw_MB_S_20031200_S109]|uniref:Uncharacterized protein n=1 Tax=Microcystis wesenbergii Mw_MB_S_20031200_S109D TaxID=2486241 RepID=A0A552LY71_9CHRO|nr:MAG: hypothetical protein EWV41_14830 [Microcystis wesenbergii Mw_MB_S_20031200_S109]TRV25149.1 MAG: hypothetical protein EWV88_08130 [Microcystis wesenbergii Mw_MB_S_20031200_S109D]
MKRETIALIAAFIALGTATVVLVTAIVTQQQLAAHSEMIESWLGLAGMGKLPVPPKLDKPLQSFRNQWAKTNPTVTPFLGLWHDDGGAFGNSYFLSIFPSQVQGQACVLEFRLEQKVAAEVVDEQILSLSTAKVINGQLLSSRLRADKSTIVQKDFDNGYPVEFLPVLVGQNEIVIFASYSPPQLPPEFPQDLTSQVKQELSNRGCTMD